MPQILGCLAYRECYSEGVGGQKEVQEHQLKRKIVKVWREIHADKDLLRRLMSSIPKRCRAVIQSRGDQIR